MARTSPPSGGEHFELVRQAVRELPSAVFTARRTRGLSLREVCAQAGVSLATLSKFERGGDVKLSTALALLGWLAGLPTVEQE